MVVVDLDGNKIEGRYNPSSDTETHRILYREFPEIGGIVHTHSTWATSWAQSGRGIPCYGTTHADYLYGEVPCVRNLTKDEIEEAYETNTGILITEEFKARGLDYNATPAVLCKTMVHLRGAGMRRMQFIMQSFWSRLPRWLPIVNRSIQRICLHPRNYRISITIGNTVRMRTMAEGRVITYLIFVHKTEIPYPHSHG